MPGNSSHAQHALGHKRKLRKGQPEATSKLDDALERRFCRLVREGLSYERCTDLVGISRQTLYDWLNRGSAEPETRYGRFERAVRRANAQAVRKLHNEVRKSNPQWILERRFSEYAPPRSRTEISGPEGGPIFNPFTVNVITSGQKYEFPEVDESGNGNGAGDLGTNGSAARS
jgi:hypothetical protein